jgi:hypothetical protein
MLNTRAGEMWNANDVINSNDLRKRLINVDSQFRSDCAQPITDFQFRLEHTYKNVIRIKVASVEIPNTFYTFSTTRQNTTFRVQTNDINHITRLLTVVIPDGNYTSSELMDKIQDQFDNFRKVTGIFLEISLDVNSGKVTIINQGLRAAPVLPGEQPTNNANETIISFQTTTPSSRHNCLGIGYNLGFRQVRYVSAPNPIVPPATLITYSITGEAIIDTIEDHYLLLRVNDFHTLEHKTCENYLQEMAKIIVREDKNMVIYDDGSSCVSNEIIFPQPQNLSVLQLTLYDAYGQIIDLNGINWSLTLEITEVLNTRLYDFYRNYIWLGNIPSVPYNSIGGSGVGLLNGIGPPF